MKLPYLREGAKGKFHWRHIENGQEHISEGAFEVVKVRAKDFIIRASFTTPLIKVKESVYCTLPTNSKDNSRTAQLFENGYTLHQIEKYGEYFLTYTFQ